MKKYVKCPTEEIWDFVYQNSNIKFPTGSWKEYKEESALCFEDNEYCYIKFYEIRKDRFVEVTLSDYCLENGINNPFEKDNETLLITIL
jgi:hypothetical protein